MIVDEGYTIYMQHFYSHDIDMWVYDPGNCSLGCGGHLPSWVTFTVEIVQGQEYGSIHNLLTDESADYFTNIETIDSWAGVSEIRWFEFVADGVQPDTSSPAHVIIRYTPSDMSVGIVEHNFYVEYNDVVPVEEGILVQFADSVIAPGDTTEIILKRQNSDGTVEDFSEYDGFEIGMIDGCEAGQILVGGVLAPYFEEAYQPIYFVADSNLTETDTVKVRAGLIEGIIGSSRPVVSGGEQTETKAIDNKKFISKGKLNKNIKEPEPLPMNPATYCFIGEIVKPYMGDGVVVVEDESIEIMLGETKYFQARYKTVDKLIIEEVEPGSDGVPQLNGGLTSDVWGSNPVGVVECDTCGKKMGVYWEKKYPTNDFIEEKIPGFKKKFTLVRMENLPNGLIRLVGRYWSPDSTYIVKLKANKDNDSTEIKVRVIKPSKLSSSSQSTSYRRARDVMNREINIDSLCILFGGKYGIPPQFIKGQMKTESLTKTFTFDDGTNGEGFAPSYRYEPFTEQYNDNLMISNYYNLFFIFDSTYTFSDVPTNHSHIRYINYPTSINTVWDMIEKYSKLVDPNPSVNYYGKRDPSTHRVSLGYTIIDTVYSNRAELIRKSKPSWNDVQVYDSTNNYMIQYLQFEWKNPKSSLANKGTKNNIAQTRAASSYGFAQFLYGTARDNNYPKEAVPENINHMDYVELFYITQKKYLKNGLGNAVESGNNWNDGYDYSFCRRIYVPKWNQGRGYAKDLIINSRLFTPQK